MSEKKSAEKPTAKQKKFAKEYALNGGKGVEAALKAYGTNNRKRAGAIASANLKKPAVQEALRAELEEHGITLPNALRPISKALNATKIDLDGNVVDDLDMQLKGSDRALKLLLPDQKTENSLNINAEVKSININIKNYGRK